MIAEHTSRGEPHDPDWELTVVAGPAASLHAAAAALVSSDPVRPLVRVAEATSPAVVLGSSQPSSHVDSARLAAAGVELVRRRSGGGAMLVGPAGAGGGQDQACLWVDVVLPPHVRGWRDDVRAAAVWLGRRWVEALADVGVGSAEVWAGGMQRRPWSERVCFAGVGPGEVLLGGRKLAGISQRRTRRGALFQCALPMRWRPGDLADLLALSPEERAALGRDLADVAATVTPDVAAALPAALRARLQAAGAARVA